MRVFLYSDASVCKKSKTSAWAVVVEKVEQGRSVSYAIAEEFSSHVDRVGLAEMFAVYNGFLYALRHGLIRPCDEVLVQTDSQAARRQFAKVPQKRKQKLRDWQSDATKIVDKLYALANDYQIALYWKWEPRNSDKQSKTCDKLAFGIMDKKRRTKI